MYGMVNRAAKEMIASRYGESMWNDVRLHAGIEETEFQTMRQYPDDVTYRIVTAAAALLDVEVSSVLENFGEYWLEFARTAGYQYLLDFRGTTLFEFLDELDDLHSRLSLSFTDYRPPSFYCTDVTDDSARVHYLSDREGLAPFVVGLLRGLGRLFEVDVAIRHEVTRSDDHDHDVFHLRVNGS